MFKDNFQIIELYKIDFSDYTYRYSISEPDKFLKTSIQKVGLINPVTVQQVDKKYRIVTGFKRAAVLSNLGVRECPAFVINDPEPQLDLFMRAVQDNQSVKPLNPVELARILNTLLSAFNIGQETIVQEYLPQLGYGKNPRVLQLYQGLDKLSESWQLALINDQVAIDFAQEMLKQDIDIQNRMWQLISDFRLGKNRQREFFALLSDVARLSDITLVELLESEDIQHIQTDEKLTPSQKTERLKSWLWERRYPRYSKVKADYDEILRKVHLPQNCFIQAPPYFEGNIFSAGFSFSSIDEFEQNLSALQKALDSGAIQAIVGLT